MCPGGRPLGGQKRTLPVVNPVDPPGPAAVGGTPALPRVRRGQRRVEGTQKEPRAKDDTPAEEDKSDAPRKGRYVDEQA